MLIASLTLPLQSFRILLLQKSKRHALSKDAIETWLASRPDDYYYSFTNEKTSDALLNYERIIELYCLHVLPSLGDWNSARDFLEWNNVLGQEKLEVSFQFMACLSG